jgi:nicotinamidase/pyrazinamidase
MMTMTMLRNAPQRRHFLQAAAALGAAVIAPPLLAADAKKISPSAQAALIVVDVQNCFVDGGTLPVKGGADVVPVINALAPKFQNIIVTQDWHTPGHTSFASAHNGTKPFDSVKLNYGNQVLWPDHCVQGTPGAALRADLDQARVAAIFRKGTDRAIDSYSAAFDNGHRKATGLIPYLRGLGVTHVDVVGLATDYCVSFTAQDLADAGFATAVLRDACRGVNLSPGDVDRALAGLTGVTVR